MHEEERYICPICQKPLADGPNGVTHWCDKCYVAYDIHNLEKLSAWRKMSWEDRVREVNARGRAAIDVFGISSEQFAQAMAFSARQSTEIISSADVAPDKEALLSLARGLSDEGALREMIDNSLDCSQHKRGGAPIHVSVELNGAEGYVRVTDDAGGMTRDEMMRCLKLGSHTPGGHVENIIGRFGVGAKEAIYHFGREITISSRDSSSASGVETFVPESWLTHDDWKIYFRDASVEAGTTTFLISVLEHFDFDRDHIAAELWKTYSKRILSGRLNLTMDGKPLQQSDPPTLLYPPELYPRKYRFYMANVMVDVDVAMLADHPESAGIYFYTFGRLYARWAWSDPLTRLIVEKPPQHRLNSHFRLDIDFQGAIDDIPISSNKDKVDTSNILVRPLGRIVAKIVQPYLSAISWLSQEGNMRYLSRYAGAKNKHASINAESPGYASQIDFGKVYDGMAISKSLVGDPRKLYDAISIEQRDEVGATAVDLPISSRLDSEASGETVSTPRKASNSAAPTLLDVPASFAPSISAQNSTITVSLLTNDPGQIRLLKTEIENAAASIGVKITIA